MNRRNFLLAACILPLVSMPALCCGPTLASALAEPGQALIWVNGGTLTERYDWSARTFRPIKDAGRSLLMANINSAGVLLAARHKDGQTISLRPWRFPLTAEVAVLTNHGEHKCLDKEDPVAFLRQRTITYPNGKVVVFSSEPPPEGYHSLRHVRI